MMTIIRLVLARYLHKPMSSLLSVILFTIGVAVISLVIKSEYFLQNSYKKNLTGIDLVVGAKGSPLQLILSSVLNADVPTGNISLEEVHKIEKNPLVKKTIPLSLGDNYKGFRIVGTNTDYLDLYHAQLSEGTLFTSALDAVVGAHVAQQCGIKLNDHFTGVHGFMHEGHSHDEFKYTVTGILEPTGTVIDNLILTPLESVWVVHSHHHHSDDEDHEHEYGHNEDTCGNQQCTHSSYDDEHEHAHDHQAKIEAGDEKVYHAILHKIEHNKELTEEEQHIYNEHKGILTEEEHDPDKEITSLLVFYRNPMAAATLPRMINKNTSLQAAAPALEFNRLLSLLGYGITVLKLLAWIIIVISGINIFIYLLNSINQSIGEIALLRATGVSRPKIFLLILMQGSLLAVLGWISGVVLSVLIWYLMPWSSSGSMFNSNMIQKDLMLFVYCIIVAIAAGIIPAIKIYNNKIHYLLTR